MASKRDPVAFVTGASSGLGRALALALAQDGYAVGIFARRAPLLEALAAEILDSGGRVSLHAGDVGDTGAVDRAVREVARELGPIDLLVANAGVGGDRTRGKVLGSEVERVMRINFLGAVYSAGAVLPDMRRRRSGHIVCVSSLTAYGGLPKAAAYSASKAALTTYFESLRIELRGSGVDVTVLTPGWVRTPMTAENDKARPFILELDAGVRAMRTAIRKRRRAHAFPWQLATAVRLGRLLPRPVYDFLLGGRKF